MATQSMPMAIDTAIATPPTPHRWPMTAPTEHQPAKPPAPARREYTAPAALVQASLTLLLIRNSRLTVNSRNGSTTSVHAGPSTTG